MPYALKLYSSNCRFCRSCAANSLDQIRRNWHDFKRGNDGSCQLVQHILCQRPSPKRACNLSLLQGPHEEAQHRILDTTSEMSHSLQVGSYGRGTAIHGTSDVDMIFQLPNSLRARYSRYRSNGQSALLQAVRDSVMKTYPRTRIGATPSQAEKRPFRRSEMADLACGRASRKVPDSFYKRRPHDHRLLPQALSTSSGALAS